MKPLAVGKGQKTSLKQQFSNAYHGASYERNCEPRARLTFLGSGISKRYANGNGNVNKGPDCGNTVLFLLPSLMSREINVHSCTMF